MCGIVGLIDLTGQPVDRAVLDRMCDAIQHRGPDDRGLHISAPGETRTGNGSAGSASIGLGHRRLSIIDLTPAGRQPLRNEEGSIWIVYNGEIYNFQSIRTELESHGRRFRTRTDTEVIIQAYERWGIECLQRFRGMFAFGLWDQPNRRLFLARDRVGKKPLFYARVGQRFLFASELQALLADREVPREVDPVALDAYLAWGYVPAPKTAFRGIFKLPPGHWLTLDLSSNEPELRVGRYWSLPYLPKSNVAEEQAVEMLREKLTEAVRLRLISDVPLGAFLSGGIDSSVVVGLMASLSDSPVKTFSIGFDVEAFNELQHARRVAERWGTDHHEYVVQPDALAILPKLVRHYGEPYADSSAIPTYYVSKMTTASVKVALNGDGGDESFAGYERYLGNRVAERVQAVPGGAWSLHVLGRVLPDLLNPKNRLRMAKRFLSVVDRPMAQRYGRWLGYFDEVGKQELYSDRFRAILEEEGRSDWMEPLFKAVEELDPVDASMAVDVASYLPYDLLVKVDITSMANSLEARSPFLDHEVMEFAARLPVDLKLRGAESKYLLKRAFADLVPRENMVRRKMGFGVPVGEWFRGPLRPLLREALLSDRAARRNYFKPLTVRRLVDDHQERRADQSFHLWNLLMLELWHQEYID